MTATPQLCGTIPMPVFDFTIDRVVDIFDNREAINAIDVKEQSGNVFDNYTLELEFTEYEVELKILFNVKASDGVSEYNAYSFYSKTDGIMESKRGDIRGYFYESITYPGYAEPITITDIADRDKLKLSDENYLFDRIAAIVTVDTEALEKSLNLSDGTFDSWKSIKVSEYTISRTEFSPMFTERLDGTMTISESELDTLPPGTYNIAVHDGPGHNVQIFRTDKPKVPRELNSTESWLYPWVTNYGGDHYTDRDAYDLANHYHDLVDFYLTDTVQPDYDEFLAFCREVFGIYNAGDYVTKEFVEQHGGHGGKNVISRIVSDSYENGVHTITVDFFADVMYTVLARKNEYIVSEYDGGFRIDAVRTVYDSGLKVSAWNT